VDPRFLHERLKELSSRGAAARRYTILEEIARGGMASILKVWDGYFQRPLAMKVLLSGKKDSGTGASDPREIERLQRFFGEAQILAQMDHQGIVPVHDIGINSDGDAYFTMGLIEGRDLTEIIELARRKEQGWSPNRALEVIVKVCETVAYAHSASVIHRDLKPSNVLVGTSGRVYVMDWGLAKVVGQRDPHDLRIRPEESGTGSPPGGHDGKAPLTPLMTMDGSVLGTPTYMSPEQAQGNLEDLGPHSDVYSVGAMLYTLLTGRMPYVKPGPAVSPHAILLALRNGPPAPIADLDPGAPVELAAICEKAMARKIEERYADMNALMEDLRAHLESRIVTVGRTGLLARGFKWTVRNKSLATGMAALAVAMVAVIGISRIRSSTAEPRQAPTLTW
jgi:serine/threonine-protein kinase